jgi:hypothetical protein
MPPPLLKAHQKLDTLVMKAYGFAKDLTEAEVVGRLMEMYPELVSSQ